MFSPSDSAGIVDFERELARPPCVPTLSVNPSISGLSSPSKFLKRRSRHKDGKDHIYYSVCEGLRVHNGRVIQRQVLHLMPQSQDQQNSQDFSDL